MESDLPDYPVTGKSPLGTCHRGGTFEPLKLYHFFSQNQPFYLSCHLEVTSFHSRIPHPALCYPA